MTTKGWKTPILSKNEEKEVISRIVGDLWINTDKLEATVTVVMRVVTKGSVEQQ